MNARKRTFPVLCASLAISLGAVACGGNDETGSEIDLTTTTASVETLTGSLDVASAEWSSFCASEQSMLEGELAAMTTTPLDYAQLEEALAPGGTPISDDAADLLASLSDMAETWDSLAAAIVNSMFGVKLNLDDPGWTLLTGEQGVLLVNFMYETEGSPLPLPVEQEAIAFSDASSALAATAQELGLDECALLTEDTEETESDSSPTSTGAQPPAPTTGVDFEDQFDGAFGDGWSWLDEDPDLWSLTATPGWLQIAAVEAARNVLVRDAPHDPYEITTALRFRPTTNFQFAGLVVGLDVNNLLQLGRAYCDLPDICIGDGVYLDNVENNEMLPSSSAEIATSTEVVYLRLVVDGDSYAGYVSEDGTIWTLVGERTRSFDNTEIGLIAYQATQGPAVAEFDYITVTSPSDGAAPLTASAATTITNTRPGLPSYEEVLAAYGKDAELCTTEAEVKSQRPDGSLEIEVRGGTFVTDNRMEFPCFGMRLFAITPVSVDGTDYPPGSVLVVAPTTDPTALRDGVEIGNPVVIEGEGFAITVGPTGATWALAPDVRLLQIDESVTVVSTPEAGHQGSAQLPDEYLGLTERKALDLAASLGFEARVTVRDEQWLPETDEYLSGRFNFIVEAGIVVDGWIET